MTATAQKISGTPAELATKLSLNGRHLSQAEVGFLTRILDGNGAKKIDTVKSGGGRGGKPATKWELNPRATLKFDVVEEKVSQTSHNAQSGKRGANAQKDMPEQSNTSQARASNDNGIGSMSKNDLAEVVVSAVVAAFREHDKQASSHQPQQMDTLDRQDAGADAETAA